MAFSRYTKSQRASVAVDVSDLKRRLDRFRLSRPATDVWRDQFDAAVNHLEKARSILLGIPADDQTPREKLKILQALGHDGYRGPDSLEPHRHEYDPLCSGCVRAREIRLQINNKEKTE